MASLTSYAVGALLVASVGLNIRFYTQSPAPPPAKTRSADTAEAEAASRSDGTCERRLAACQRQAWEVAARAFGNDHGPRDDPAPVVAAVPEAGVDASGPAAQASTLCALAENALRDQWRRDGIFIALNLKRSFGDSDEQDRNVTQALKDMQEVTGLDQQQAASLEAAYRDKRNAQLAAARAGMDRDPPDMGAVFDAAKGVMVDEDALLERISGPAGRDAWREHQLESRTVLLALFASLGGKDWDDSIHW